MSRAVRYPVWRYMGWWKWPSMALLLFCGVAIYLYFDLAPGGAARWGAQSFEGRLAGCPVHAGADTTAEGLSLLVRIDPACAWTLAEPQVAITTAAGKTLFSRDIGGLPNPDRLTLPAEDIPSGPLSIIVTARADAGESPARVTWTLSQDADRGVF